MNYQKIALFLAFVLVHVVSPTMLGWAQTPRFDPLSADVDWQPQDYVDSRGITRVRWENGRLVCHARLIGGHPNYSKGEVFLDLRYVPGLEASIDMRQGKLVVEIEVPESFAGSPMRPNGVQAFVKDDHFGSQYGDWKNVTECPAIGGSRRCIVEVRPTIGPIRILGVKFAISTGSLATYDGPLSVTKMTIDPPITLSSPPSLPSTTPSPILNTGSHIQVTPERFSLNQQPWLIVGGNWRILEYGQNFGATAWFPFGNGVSKHPNFLRITLDYWRRAGVKVIRVGLLDDGRTMFDKDGNVTGYDAIFKNDVQMLLELAYAARMRMEFVWLDFLIAGKAEELNGVWLRGRPGIITDPTLRGNFLTQFLVPFLRDFAQHPGLFGFDVLNEPEWIVSKQDGGGWEDVANTSTKAEVPIPGQTLKSFLGDCLAVIRQYALGKFVTVGTSSVFIPLVSDLSTDYSALHHYPWMGELRDYLPLLPPGKPWSLEEYPTANTSMSLTDHLDLALGLGGAGAMLWNVSPGIDESTFPHEARDAILQELRAWVTQHAGEIYSSPTLGLTLNQQSFTPGTRVQLDLEVVNPGPAILVDVYFGALLPQDIGPALGCPGGDAVIFLVDWFSRTQIICLSAPPQNFEVLLRNVTLPAGWPTTEIPNLFSFIWPADFPAGIYTFFISLTLPGALGDGRIDPDDIITLDAQMASFHP